MARTRCSEGALMHITREITALRRRDMDKKEKFRLNADDMREDAELRKIIIESLAFNIGRLLPASTPTRTDADAQKAAEAAATRQSARAPEQPSRNQHTGPRDPRQQ